MKDLLKKKAIESDSHLNVYTLLLLLLCLASKGEHEQGHLSEALSSSSWTWLRCCPDAHVTTTQPWTKQVSAKSRGSKSLLYSSASDSAGASYSQRLENIIPENDLVGRELLEDSARCQCVYVGGECHGYSWTVWHESMHTQLLHPCRGNPRWNDKHTSCTEGAQQVCHTKDTANLWVHTLHLKKARASPKHSGEVWKSTWI